MRLPGRKPSHFALPVLANLAPAFAQDFFLLENGFAPFAQGVAGQRSR